MQMASWLINRIVLGMGAASKDAVLPLSRRAISDSIPAALAPAVVHAWRGYLPTSYGSPGACFSTSAAPEPTSQPNAAPAASGVPAAAAAAGSPPSAPADSTPAPLSAAGPAGPQPSVGAASGSVSADVVEGSSSAAAGPLPEPKPELVEKFLSVDVRGANERRRVERQQVLRDFQRHPADTGSPQVMVALWTHRVRELVRHFDANRKQLPAMRELEMMVNQRRRLLVWLRQSDFEAYSYTITKLGLRDIYTPTGISDRYREGLRPSDPVTDDAVNRRRFNFHTKYRQRKTSQWLRLRPQLVAEDPSLEAADVATAAADRQLRQQQQQQRIAAVTQQQ